MSGRKSSEVAAVLKKAEKTRAATEANYRNAASARLDSIQKHAENLEAYEKEISAMSVALTEETRKELREEAEALEKEWNQLRSSAGTSRHFQEITAKLRNRREEYDNTLRSLDRQADDVREAVKKRQYGWYCDEEYAQAQRIQENMKKLSEQKNAFLHELEKEENNANAEEIRLRNLIEQMRRDAEKAAQLNQRAADMIHLRQEAGKAKDCIRNLIREIPAERAVKFLPEQYQRLCSQAEAFYRMTDAEVVQGLSGKMSEISKFSMELDTMYQAWKAAKEKTEQFLLKIKTLVKEGKYYHPNQYLANPETAQAIELFAFLSAYHDDEYEKQFAGLVQKAQQLLDAEKFEESCQALTEAETLLMEANAYAGTLQNQLIGSFQLAVDTRDIMHHAGFKVKTSFINGKDARDGFCVKCTMGDETIDFDKVMMKEDGSVVMDMYHTEGANSCGTSWKLLQEKFNDAGIPMTDVKKNGNSIFRKQAAVQGGDRKQQH